MYVVRYDLGFSPNPFDGVCTLACCMPVIRRMAQPGDWIIGMGGKDLKAKGRCIYAMRVTDDLTFEKYWEDERFQSKRPVRNGSRRTMVGDNIYHRDPSSKKWLQENSVHSQPTGEQEPLNTAHDTQTDRVLLSEHFFYFGEKAPVVPPRILTSVGFKNGRGHRVYDQKKCEILLSWIDRKAESRPNRIIGDPFQFRMSAKRFSKSKNKLV